MKKIFVLIFFASFLGFCLAQPGDSLIVDFFKKIENCRKQKDISPGDEIYFDDMITKFVSLRPGYIEHLLFAIEELRSILNLPPRDPNYFCL